MNKRKKHKNKALTIIILAIVVLIAIAVSLTGFITDLIWFDEVGYTSVFLTEIITKIKLGIPAFLVATALGVIFLRLLKRNFLKKSDLEISDSKNRKSISKIMWLLSLIFAALFTAIVINGLWFEILKYLNSSAFNITDPLFQKDLGFYIFKLEFLEGLSGDAMQLAILLIALTVVFYLLLLSFAHGKYTPQANDGNYSDTDFPDGDYTDNNQDDDVIFEVKDGIVFNSRNFNLNGDLEKKINDTFNKNFKGKTPMGGGGDFKQKLKALLNIASTQLSVLGVLFFLAVAVRFRLMQYDLLYGGTGVAYGAGYTDITVTLNIYRIIMVCSIISAAMLVISIKRKKILPAVIFPAIMVALVVLQGPVTGLVQNYIVAPDEINKERQYIGYNIDYTRTAYDLADISVRDFEPLNNLTKETVLDNMETFSNIRINDFEPAEQFYNQTQSIRSYYTFNDVDVDRYYVNGEYTQVFLSAREIDQSRVEDSWLIKHLKYTHGYGITLSRVDRVTSSGQPDMLIDSIPPVSEVPEIRITRPEIYYGESTNDYVIVGTSEQEFDYPSGESNVYCKYQGNGGIPLTLLNKLLFTIREGSLKMLVSGNIGSDSRIMIYRDIMTRVKKIAPFLAYDEKPYLIVDDNGKLFWMLDAYTLSEYYPYSEPYSDKSDNNYIRNSVKVTVDAYNGTVNFYIADEKDPIVQTLAKIYPGLLKNMSQMPSDLKAHIQYPNTLLSIQASVYMKYHMTDEEVFYQNEDLWAIANEFYGQVEQQLTPINFIMKLPGEENCEFISSLPYTPNGKSNMTGILIARSDGANYGELVLYRLPKDRIIYGPAQIEAQINQDAEISKEFSLWNNSGASYSRGNLFVFPVGDSLIYAEPIYMESSSSSLPEVKRVVMYYGDQVAYESTLAECLDTLFGAGTGDPLKTAFPIETGHAMAQEIRDGKEEIVTPIDPIPGEETPGQVEQEPGQTNEKEIVKDLINETTKLLEKLQEYLNTLN